MNVVTRRFQVVHCTVVTEFKPVRQIVTGLNSIVQIYKQYLKFSFTVKLCGISEDKINFSLITSLIMFTKYCH